MQKSSHDHLQSLGLKKKQNLTEVTLQVLRAVKHDNYSLQECNVVQCATEFGQSPIMAEDCCIK